MKHNYLVKEDASFGEYKIYLKIKQEVGFKPTI